jgi:hypothetical protein
MQGDQCWITLPKEAEPGEVWGPQNYDATALKEIVKLWKTIADPVMPMERALYGHPDSVTFWEEFCNKSTRKVGFKDLGPDWPSVFFHPALKLLLSIYVDDFKLAGPTENLAKGWRYFVLNYKSDLSLTPACIWVATSSNMRFCYPTKCRLEQ